MTENDFKKHLEEISTLPKDDSTDFEYINNTCVQYFEEYTQNVNSIAIELLMLFLNVFWKLLKEEAYEELEEFCSGSEQNRIFCQHMFYETKEYLRKINFYSDYLKIQCEISNLQISLNIHGLPWSNNTITDIFVSGRWIPVTATLEVKS